ncbi:U-box domain protein [Angomonas deanei]|nr:U-box domain protein [Angomonas deanei]|eukprot:EPY29835.1 U-box domain protein [Angomonas deanei]
MPCSLFVCLRFVPSVFVAFPLFTTPTHTLSLSLLIVTTKNTQEQQKSSNENTSGMSTVFEVDARLRDAAPVQEAEVDKWIQFSDPTNAGQFYGPDVKAAFASASNVSKIIVSNYLNNPDANVVPLRRKTKLCLILNNFALFIPVRNAVFEALDNLTNIFETSIKQEGTMPFDSELGRMSEHVLVLLMRVTNYKLKASAVHEFAEHNTQFAIQLLLAILLKEPPYEFELRCNCIAGLLGFTQPQAFFGAGASIEEHSCTNFTEKVDFMLGLMLRLQAVQVVSDVLGDALVASGSLTTLVQTGVNNMMRTIMNMHKFASKDATQWRQHILLSTTFLDGTVLMYIQAQTVRLQQSLARNPPAVAGDLVQSLTLAFRFGAFASYHLGVAASELRIYCTFFNDLFQLSIRPIVMDARLSGQVMIMYTHLLFFLCNVDALGGEKDVSVDELLPELTSAALCATVEKFLRAEVGGCGLPFTQAWHQQFRRFDNLLAQETATYQFIENVYNAIESQLASSAQPAAPSAPQQQGRLLGDVPSLKKAKTSQKVSIANAAQPVKVNQKLRVAQKKDVTAGVDPELLCALTGQVMKNPVTSPYGQTFERDAIMNWLDQNGSVCPITGKPLSAAQLTPNVLIANKIMQQLVKQSMAAPKVDGEDDLYNF